MGETATHMCSVEECDADTLLDFLSLRIEQLAPEAAMTTPKELIDNWKPLEINGIITMDDGSAMLPLPSDFLRLFSLRLEGWARPVTDFSLPASVAAALQSNKCASLRGTSGRPVAVLAATAQGRALRLYGKHSDPPHVAEGWYLPIPRADPDGFIDIPEAAIPRLLDMLTQSSLH